MSSSFSIDPIKARVLAAVAALCAVSVLVLQWLAPGFELDAISVRAAKQTQIAYAAIRELRLEQGIAIDPELDPGKTGLIGCEYSDLTTTVGDLTAKRTSVNPAFSALIVHWLESAGVQPGDTVAASFSGSFPALNAAALCAFDALGVNAIVFSSVGASVYGANIPGLTWLEMEKRLHERGVVRNKTSFASYGGIVDTEGGIDATGFALAWSAIAKHGATFVEEGSPKTVERDAKRRMELFFRSGKPKAFVNVGGNVTSFGWIPEASLLSNGLLRRVPSTKSSQRGTIFRMVEAGVPVIHLLNINRLAARYHLEVYSQDGSIDMRMQQTGKRKWFMLCLLFALWLFAAVLLMFRSKSSIR